ncbi:MAG TPA: amino acid permease [Candidatus Kapabacteria bacterium]|nr:amino acid permease [Candidatus Kapabacteria bacterium]
MQKNSGLAKALGFSTVLAIVVGAVIGSGIFKKPAVMAQELGSPELLILVWVLAGAITLIGALANAEVASMIPETGGQFIYFQRMYGNLFAYIYGWSILAVIQTASIASITYVFAEYAEFFVKLPHFSKEIEESLRLYMPFVGWIYPLRDFGVKILTVFTICFLSGVNYLGIKYGGYIADVVTWLKVVVMMLLVVFAFMYSGASINNFSTDLPTYNGFEMSTIGSIILALSAAFWAYDGWNNITYIAGEVKNPQRNIPLALIVGTIIVIAVYIAINLAYLYVLPIEVMAQSRLVAADMANMAIGGIGGAVVAALVMVSTFGTSNGTIMVSARVYYSMSKNGLFFDKFGKAHPKYHTPANALILQAVWSSILVFSGSFDDLTDMLIFVSWIFYAFGALGVFVLRKKMPDAPRPYKVPGYPYLPAIFVIFAFGFVFLTLYEDISNFINGKSEMINSTFGLILTALGIPLYYYFKRKNRLEE